MAKIFHKTIHALAIIRNDYCNSLVWNENRAVAAGAGAVAVDLDVDHVLSSGTFQEHRWRIRINQMRSSTSSWHNLIATIVDQHFQSFNRTLFLVIFGLHRFHCFSLKDLNCYNLYCYTLISSVYHLESSASVSTYCALASAFIVLHCFS